MGGDSHGSEEQAYFLGMKPGAPSEGFEMIYAITMISTLTVLIGGSYMRDQETFMKWSMREAIAREKLIEKGGVVEFGKYYQHTKYIDVGPGSAPDVDEE
jgi:hypothetical protein